MYRCDVCDRVSESGQPTKTIIFETRRIEHPQREKVYWHRPKPGERKGRWVGDPGGIGTAIVRELRVCEDCYARQRERNPDGS